MIKSTTVKRYLPILADKQRDYFFYCKAEPLASEGVWCSLGIAGKYPNIVTLYNQHYVKANVLTGYQLIDSVIIGHDGSWSNKCSKVFLEYFVNHEKITIHIDHTGSRLMFAINDSASQIKKF